MARYKHIDTSPRFIAVDLQRQLLRGTFEHALSYLVDHRLDLMRAGNEEGERSHGSGAGRPDSIVGAGGTASEVIPMTK